MIYLLDTNAIIKIMNGDLSVMRRARRHPGYELGISAIVLYELYFGAFKGARTAASMQFINGLQFETISFNGGDALAAAEIRSNLTTAGKLIGPYDILIAGQALARDLTLITHNTREFSRVAGLRVEDWES